MKTICSPKIQLNEYQTAAVEDVSPACLVNACVGSGKTTVLTEKVRWLHRVQNVPYEEMMVLTFTNKAAGEIADRLGITRSRSFGTFHSVAAALMNEVLPVEECGWQKDFSVILPEEEQELALSLIEEHGLKIKYRNRLAKRLEQERPLQRRDRASRIQDDLPRVFPLLQEAKRRQNRMSYGDLLDNCMFLLQRHPCHPRWVIVDEVQDCNRQQVELLKLLVGEDSHLFAVGDPNQMIYSFRGGDQSLFYYIREYFHAKELSLPVNYRSDPAILALANRFRQFGGKIEGSASENGSQKRIPVSHYYDAFLEAEILAEKIRSLQENGIPYGRIAVLYRLKEQSPLLESAFGRLGIPYLTQEQIREDSHETARENPAAEEAGQRSSLPEGVSLLTLHAAKGLEFEAVFLIGVNKGLIPMAGKDPVQQEEEQRLFFVGLTRARQYLELSWYTNPTQFQASGEISPFLKRIPPELLKMEEERSRQEKTANLQQLRREVARQRQKQAEEKTVYAVHPKYGKGILLSDDGMTVKVKFPGYGEKEFLKMFGEITILKEQGE